MEVLFFALLTVSGKVLFYLKVSRLGPLVPIRTVLTF
jgi:hypothetical protein